MLEKFTYRNVFIWAIARISALLKLLLYVIAPVLRLKAKFTRTICLAEGNTSLLVITPAARKRKLSLCGKNDYG